jgi:hypothetical protein
LKCPFSVFPHELGPDYARVKAPGKMNAAQDATARENSLAPQ